MEDFPVSENDYTGQIKDGARDLKKLLDMARKEGSSLFVHCHVGLNRSPTIVMAYLIMYRFAKNLEEALSYLLSLRNFIEPEQVYLDQLKTI